MVGPLVYGCSEDEGAAAKGVGDFAKTSDKLVIRGGVFGGKALDVDAQAMNTFEVKRGLLQVGAQKHANQVALREFFLFHGRLH